MRKLLFILLLLCGMLSSVNAQDIRALFMDAPDAVLPLLPRNVRADCIDFADAGMEYPVQNLLGGESLLKELSKDYLLLQSTASSTVAMKILPFGGSNIVCVINSVSAEATDSRVAFYDSSWKKLDASLFFRAPSIKDFFADADAEILDICDIYLVSLRLNATDGTLVAEYTMPQYMNSDDAAKIRGLLRTIAYRWNGTMFVKD